MQHQPLIRQKLPDLFECLLYSCILRLSKGRGPEDDAGVVRGSCGSHKRHAHLHRGRCRCHQPSVQGSHLWGEAGRVDGGDDRHKGGHRVELNMELSDNAQEGTCTLQARKQVGVRGMAHHLRLTRLSGQHHLEGIHVVHSSAPKCDAPTIPTTQDVSGAAHVRNVSAWEMKAVGAGGLTQLPGGHTWLECGSALDRVHAYTLQL
mmetsp:Transcript_20963/g.35785  ORF Transcript_20963/g.35785 Transcript_20963/m.35785 type:complete len:205 (-) Transcript_20963:58-672(-)